jgi:SAM-dependent methyltransferase
MIGKSIDFDRVALYYDAHVLVDFDLPWWIAQVERHARTGPVLEVMCGTGRISLPLLRACPDLRLVCVDYSAGLLARLRDKLDASLVDRCEAIEADLRELVLDRRFPLVILGFHAFAELSERDDAMRALVRIRELLEQGGVFVTVMHDPVARGATIGSQWVDLGTHALVGEPGRVRVRACWQWVDTESGLVEGVQEYVELDDLDRERARVELPVRFRLWAPETFEQLAAEAGLAVVERGFDYRLDTSEPASPRVRAWTLRRAS